MFYVKNLPAFERILRVCLGAAMIFAGFWMGKGLLLTVLLVGSGLAAVLTGFFGFCPMCALVGRKLDRTKGG